MFIATVYIRFFRSFNFDYLRKAHDGFEPDPWDALEPNDLQYPFVRVPLEDGVTTVVGANESGKSQLLSALKHALTGERIERGGPTCAALVTWFIDRATKVIVGVAVTPHAPSRDAVLAALRMALDRAEPFGPAGGLPGLVRVDRGKEFLCPAVTLALGAFAVPVIDLPPYNPHLKGTIEALNGAVEDMLFVSMPRYVHRQTLLNGRTAELDEPALTFEAFVELLLKWVHWWNTEHQPRKLRGRTPMEAWQCDPTPLYDVPAEQLARFGLEDDGRTRTITTQGVQWRNRHYIAPWMVGRSGEQVTMRHLPHHDATIEVFDLRGAHLGSAGLAEAASEDQIRDVRKARTAKARRLRADMKAAERLRRERFKAVTAPIRPSAWAH